jgi:hypothetical protein
VGDSRKLKLDRAMGRKNKTDKRKNKYDDCYDEQSNNKKFKKSRFNDNRKNKQTQQRLFVDWDLL